MCNYDSYEFEIYPVYDWMEKGRPKGMGRDTVFLAFCIVIIALAMMRLDEYMICLCMAGGLLNLVEHMQQYIFSRSRIQQP